MDYGFFDHKLFIEGFTSDLFSTPHIVYIVLVYVLGTAVSFALRHARRERITAFLRALSVVMPILEITKITWESYYDIKYGDGFNAGGILPLYTCSLFIYTVIAAAWGRGKVREIALSFISTIGLLYGAVGVIYCNGLNFYPFWTFGAFYSLIFHSTMFITGLYLVVSGYKRLTWRDMFYPLIPIAILCVIAIPVNYIYDADYMLIHKGGGVPLYEDIATYLASRGLRPLYTLLMFVTHIPLAGLVIGGDRLIRGVSKLFSHRAPKGRNTDSAV